MVLYRDSSLKRSGMGHVNEGSHSFNCHPHIYPQVEWTMPAFTPQPQSITKLRLVLICHPVEGRRLSWPGWLDEILRWFVRRRRSPIPVVTGPDIEYFVDTPNDVTATPCRHRDVPQHNNNTNICNACSVSKHTKSEAQAVARWGGWQEWSVKCYLNRYVLRWRLKVGRVEQSLISRDMLFHILGAR